MGTILCFKNGQKVCLEGHSGSEEKVKNTVHPIDATPFKVPGYSSWVPHTPRPRLDSGGSP